MKTCHFWVCNHPFTEKNDFFRDSINKSFSFHSYILTFEESKLGVNPLIKYEGATFLGQYDPLSPNKNFLEKLLILLLAKYTNICVIYL